MMESLVLLRQAGGATVTDAFGFRETARNVPRVTDRTRGGASRASLSPLTTAASGPASGSWPA